MDDVTTMLPPPRLRSAGIVDFNPRNTPRTLIAITWSNTSSG